MLSSYDKMNGRSIIYCLLVISGVALACDLPPSKIVQTQNIIKTWYEKKSLGEPLVQKFFKCINNKVVLQQDNTLSSERSLQFKWWPHFTFRWTGILENHSTIWYLLRQSIFGSTTISGAILASSEDYLVVKSCSDSFFFKEKTYIYSTSSADLTPAQTAEIAQALKSAGLDITSFTDISQTGC